MRKIIIIFYLLVLLHNNATAQKSDLTNLAIAGGITLGLAAILSDNGDNAQDMLESEMLDHILSTEAVKLPQMLHVGLINKPSNKQDYIKANCFIFNVVGSDFGHYVYIMVLGKNKFRNSDGFSFKKLVYLKFDKTLWEQNGIEIIKSLVVTKRRILNNNKFLTYNSASGKNDTLDFSNLKKIKNTEFVFSNQSVDDYGNESYFTPVLNKF